MSSISLSFDPRPLAFLAPFDAAEYSLVLEVVFFVGARYKVPEEVHGY